MTKAAELAKMGEVLTNSSKGRTNLIINGDMAINQRGATSGVTSGYFVDRFALSGCSASAVITSSTPTQFPTAITVSATSGNPIVTQKIESKNVQHLSGKVVTASFFAKNVSNATTLFASLQHANSADNFGGTTTIAEINLGNLTSDWVKYTASWTVPSGGLNGLSLNILCSGTSTFTMGVTGVMLQEGSVSTPFEHRSFGEELALCQRYYQKIQGSAGAPYKRFARGHNVSTTLNDVNLDLATEMRTFPTLGTTAAATYVIYHESTVTACSAVPALNTASDDGPGNSIALSCTVSSGLTAGQGSALLANNSADTYLEFISEL